MGREAKLGLVFVGILLAVFGGLLMKRLKSPAKTPGMNLFSDSTSRPETLLPARTQPQPPTLVIARGDNEKPPGTATIPSHDADQRYPIGRTEADNRQAQSSWSRAGDSREDAPPSSSRNSASNTPSLLATPLPIPTDGDRDAGKIQNDLAAGGSARNQMVPAVSGRSATDADSTLSASRETAASPLPYRSAYGAQSEGRSNPAAPGNWSGNSTGQVSPDPIAASTPSAPARYPIGSTGYQTPASRYEAQPTAGIAASQPATNNRYQATLEPPVATTPLPGNATVAPPTAIPRRDGDQYVVQPNDSYWTISERLYGTGAFFKALYEHNRKRMKNPDELKVGQVLLVPDESTLRRNYPDLCPKPRRPTATTQQRVISASARIGGNGRVYTVADGDTLFEIARHELGKPARWAEIYQLNRDLLGDDFDYLRPGTELILPMDAASGSSQVRSNTAARAPEPLYPR
jgi:nucleoid-associated protein YgaU